MEAGVDTIRPRKASWILRLFNEPGFARRSVAVGSLLFGVVGPAIGARDIAAFLDPTIVLGLRLFFGASMIALIAWLAFGARHARIAALVHGALWMATAVGIAFCAIFAPMIGFMVLGSFTISFRADLGVFVFALLGWVPLIGTLVYWLNAMRAGRAIAQRPSALGWWGGLVPIALIGALCLGLTYARDRCVASMTSDDRTVALDAARDCECLNSVVAWQSIVDAWLAARTGEHHEIDTERSNAIADAFERLTGKDLRMRYDDSARY